MSELQIYALHLRAVRPSAAGPTLVLITTRRSHGGCGGITIRPSPGDGGSRGNARRCGAPRGCPRSPGGRRPRSRMPGPRCSRPRRAPAGGASSWLRGPERDGFWWFISGQRTRTATPHNTGSLRGTLMAPNRPGCAGPDRGRLCSSRRCSHRSGGTSAPGAWEVHGGRA